MTFGQLSKFVGQLDDDSEHWEEAQIELHQRQVAALPIPTCCQAAQNYPTVVFHVDVYSGDSRKAEGKWTGKLIECVYQQNMKRSSYFDNIPEVRFCCYCGLGLPKMVRKKKFPRHTCVVTDGGYYCNTCKERLGSCRCLPPEFAFELDS